MSQAAKDPDAQPGLNGSTQERLVDEETRAAAQILQLLQADPTLQDPRHIIRRAAEALGTPSGVAVRRALWTLANRRDLRFTKDWRIELVRRAR